MVYSCYLISFLFFVLVCAKYCSLWSKSLNDAFGVFPNTLACERIWTELDLLIYTGIYICLHTHTLTIPFFFLSLLDWDQRCMRFLTPFFHGIVPESAGVTSPQFELSMITILSIVWLHGIMFFGFAATTYIKCTYKTNEWGQKGVSGVEEWGRKEMKPEEECHTTMNSACKFMI